MSALGARLNGGNLYEISGCGKFGRACVCASGGLLSCCFCRGFVPAQVLTDILRPPCVSRRQFYFHKMRNKKKMWLELNEDDMLPLAVRGLSILRRSSRRRYLPGRLLAGSRRLSETSTIPERRPIWAFRAGFPSLCAAPGLSGNRRCSSVLPRTARLSGCTLFWFPTLRSAPSRSALRIAHTASLLRFSAR